MLELVKLAIVFISGVLITVNVTTWQGALVCVLGLAVIVFIIDPPKTQNEKYLEALEKCGSQGPLSGVPFHGDMAGQKKDSGDEIKFLVFENTDAMMTYFKSFDEPKDKVGPCGKPECKGCTKDTCKCDDKKG